MVWKTQKEKYIVVKKNSAIFFYPDYTYTNTSIQITCYVDDMFIAFYFNESILFNSRISRTERDTNLTQLAHCLYDLCNKKFKGPLKKSSLGFYLIQS